MSAKQKEELKSASRGNHAYTWVHQSILPIFNKYPWIQLPTQCLSSDLDPFVVVEKVIENKKREYGRPVDGADCDKENRPINTYNESVVQYDDIELNGSGYGIKFKDEELSMLQSNSLDDSAIENTDEAQLVDETTRAVSRPVDGAERRSENRPMNTTGESFVRFDDIELNGSGYGIKFKDDELSTLKSNRLDDPAVETRAVSRPVDGAEWGDENRPINPNSESVVRFVEIDLNCSGYEIKLKDEELSMLQSDCMDHSSPIDENLALKRQLVVNLIDFVKFYEKMSPAKKSHDNGNGPFICSKCDKTFLKLKYLKAHVKRHQIEKPYKCLICPWSFLRPSELKRHAKIHSEERPFKCSKCSKTFMYNYNLKVHMESHTGKREFKCTQCEKSYFRSEYLQDHVKSVHMKDKPYKCKLCEGSFVRSSGLKVHMRSHSGERPFSCAICSRKFVRNYHLKVHMKTHD